MHLIGELSNHFHTYSMIDLGPFTMHSSFTYKNFRLYSKNPIFAGPALLLLYPSVKIGSTHSAAPPPPY